MSDERVGDIVDLANAQKPDLTVLLGDYVCTHPFVSGYVPPGAWAEQLARLEAPLGVYSVLGNHDWWYAAIPTEPADNSLSVRRALAAAGVPVLENQSVRLTQQGRPFWLIGLGDQIAHLRSSVRTRRGADDLGAAVREIRDDAPAILLAHEPYIFPAVPDRIALTLSGHMHGGQVNLPLIGPPIHFIKRRSAKFVYGEYALRDRQMIVSGGLGTSFAPVRVLRPRKSSWSSSAASDRWPERRPCRSYSSRVGAIEATSSAAIVQLKGRVTRGSLSSRLSEAPNRAQAPLQGTEIKAQSEAVRSTLRV